MATAREQPQPPEAGGGEEHGFPSGALGGSRPTDAGFWTGLHNHAKRHFCCFELPARDGLLQKLQEVDTSLDLKITHVDARPLT